MRRSATWPSSQRKRRAIARNTTAAGTWLPAYAGVPAAGCRVNQRNVASLLRRMLANERRGCVVVALLARQQRLQADKLVIVVERNELILAGGERVAVLERAQHIAHRLRRREQRNRR